MVSARVYVSGLGYFELYLNGEKVGRDVLAPNQTNYDKRPGLADCGIPVEDNFREYTVPYLAYDVTERLRSGENVIGAMLGNGFYNVRGRWTMAYGSPRLIAQLEIVYDDGSQERVVSDPTWKVAEGPVRMDQIYAGEEYDAAASNRVGAHPVSTTRPGKMPSRAGSLRSAAGAERAGRPRDGGAEAGEGRKTRRGTLSGRFR